MPFEFTHDKKKQSQDNQSRKPPVKEKKSFMNSRIHSLANFFGGIGLKQISISLYQRLIAKGDTEAMYILGKMYWWGYKIPRNTAKAVELIEYAVIRGNESAIQFKQELIDDEIWRLGKSQDKFMDVFDNRVEMESSLQRSNHFWHIVFYVVALVIIIWLLK